MLPRVDRGGAGAPGLLSQHRLVAAVVGLVEFVHGQAASPPYRQGGGQNDGLPGASPTTLHRGDGGSARPRGPSGLVRRAVGWLRDVHGILRVEHQHGQAAFDHPPVPGGGSARRRRRSGSCRRGSRAGRCAAGDRSGGSPPAARRPGIGAGGRGDGRRTDPRRWLRARPGRRDAPRGSPGRGWGWRSVRGSRTRPTPPRCAARTRCLRALRHRPRGKQRLNQLPEPVFDEPLLLGP